MASFAKHPKNLLKFLTTIACLTAAPAHGEDVSFLYAGQQLLPGQELVSGPFHLLMDRDCDFSFFSVSSTNYEKVILWRASTYMYIFTDCTLNLKNDGELVITSRQYGGMFKSSEPWALWSSHSRSTPGTYVLVVDQVQEMVKVVRVESLKPTGEFVGTVVWSMGSFGF